MVVDHRDIQNESIEWVSPSHLKLSFNSDKKEYAYDVELFGEINVEVN